MVFDKPPPSLTAQLSKIAKLSNVQNGLPLLLRGAPVVAIAAGQLLAKATNGRNAVEERLLGTEDTILLGAIESSAQAKASKDLVPLMGREGIKQMCTVCQRRVRSTEEITGLVEMSSLLPRRRGQKTVWLNRR
jgi:hypothetical protein